MPSASADTDTAMEKLFGPDDAGGWEQKAMVALEAAGYRLTKGFEWTSKPGVSEWSDMTQDEQTCMAYLFEEWDFGGLKGD